MIEEGAVPKENFLLLLFSAPLAFIFLHEERALPVVYLQWDACSKEKAPQLRKPYFAHSEQTIFAAPKNQHYCTVSSEEETMVK